MCILISDAENEEAVRRLKVMCETTDGFRIADEDLKLRGPGDFLASANQDTMRQSGGFEFKMAKLCDDSELFEKAFSSAKKIVEKDPGLLLPENEELRRTVAAAVSIQTSNIS